MENTEKQFSVFFCPAFISMIPSQVTHFRSAWMVEPLRSPKPSLSFQPHFRYLTKAEIARFNSSGDLYSLNGVPAATPPTSMLASVDLWHRRLGHPNPAVLASMLSEFTIPCNRDSHNSVFCESCQLGKHVRLPFSSSSSCSTYPFELIHCDLWTSPIASVSGFKYYLVILDDFTHFV